GLPGLLLIPALLLVTQARRRIPLRAPADAPMRPGCGPGALPPRTRTGVTPGDGRSCVHRGRDDPGHRSRTDPEAARGIAAGHRSSLRRGAALGRVPGHLARTRRRGPAL